MTSALHPVPTGYLASRELGLTLPVSILRSAAGFYLGTTNDAGLPVSRESAEYFTTHARAAQALASGQWSQRAFV
nr:hypothetical protein [uncultured Halomonas sp.]